MNTIPNEAITLTRDVDAYIVPSGDKVTLLSGNVVRITQALGGNYTILVNGNMVQITAENADALGFEVDKKPEPETDNDFSENLVWDQLRTCYDPEIPVNIVELGLVYDLKISNKKEGSHIHIKMTLTAPGCGMGPMIADDAKNKVLSIPGVNDVNVELVWEPQWNKEMMTEEARLQLGML
ncbi:MAG: putative Fe-S cluster assembly protein SufT [Chloroflexi bacterium]|nr:putative Fe-S cluster assembly protein SufT [Chloroflexota bacterium]